MSSGCYLTQEAAVSPSQRRLAQHRLGPRAVETATSRGACRPRPFPHWTFGCHRLRSTGEVEDRPVLRSCRTSLWGRGVRSALLEQVCLGATCFEREAVYIPGGTIQVLPLRSTVSGTAGSRGTQVRLDDTSKQKQIHVRSRWSHSIMNTDPLKNLPRGDLEIR